MDATPMRAPASASAVTSERRPATCARSRHAVFAACPRCDGDMRPEHAHYRCATCGWRDSCCD